MLVIALQEFADRIGLSDLLEIESALGDFALARFERFTRQVAVKTPRFAPDLFFQVFDGFITVAIYRLKLVADVVGNVTMLTLR